MKLDDVEAEALQLDPSARARLATKLLASLEVLTDEENLRLWAEEAERRDADWEASGHAGHPATEVFREARARLK
jgi:Putative addiction module component